MQTGGAWGEYVDDNRPDECLVHGVSSTLKTMTELFIGCALVSSHDPELITQNSVLLAVGVMPSRVERGAAS